MRLATEFDFSDEEPTLRFRRNHFVAHDLVTAEYSVEEIRKAIELQRPRCRTCDAKACVLRTTRRLYSDGTQHEDRGWYCEECE